MRVRLDGQHLPGGAFAGAGERDVERFDGESPLGEVDGLPDHAAAMAWSRPPRTAGTMR